MTQAEAREIKALALKIFAPDKADERDARAIFYEETRRHGRGRTKRVRIAR